MAYMEMDMEFHTDMARDVEIDMDIGILRRHLLLWSYMRRNTVITTAIAYTRSFAILRK
jgi:hypothetical protein